MNQVSLPLLKHLGSNVPLLHNKLMRNFKTGKNQVQNLYVVTRGTALRTDIFKRTEVPVTHNDQRMLFTIAKTL